MFLFPKDSFVWSCEKKIISYFFHFQMSDWDRFAAEEYELLVAEEGNAEGMEDM